MINCKGKILNFDSPIVMGILNVTPDSFSGDGHLANPKALLNQANEMLKNGASILDIGGYSSRPGAIHVSEKEELNRVIPIIQLIVKEHPNAILSIDTFRSKVAKKAIENGAHIVNDISAGNLDDNMFTTIAKLNVPYIMMHMQGDPKTMQEKPTYNNITTDIIKELAQKVNDLKKIGVRDIIIDPGFGFGKTIKQNYKLLKTLNLFEIFDLPLLIGVSRKSMIYKVINKTPQGAVNGSTALHMLALNNGAKILRVHDVKEAYECIELYKTYKNA